jgi:hypothetical protein
MTITASAPQTLLGPLLQSFFAPLQPQASQPSDGTELSRHLPELR